MRPDDPQHPHPSDHRSDDAVTGFEPLDRRTFLRRGIQLGFGAPMVAGLAGCLGSGSSRPATAKRGGTLVIGAEADADILDPHGQFGWTTWRINGQVYEGLIQRDLTVTTRLGSTPRYVPALARSWEASEDQRDFTFKLREGVTFHDGTAFDAEAVKINLERIFDKDSRHFWERANTAAGWHARSAGWKGVKVLDPMTVRVSFQNPFPLFAWDWTEAGTGMPFMVSPTALKKYGNDKLGEHPTGTGPFMFDSRDPGVSVTLKRNPKYWSRSGPLSPALLDRVIFKVLAETQTRYNALVSGEVDMIIIPPPDSIDDAVKRGFKLVAEPSEHRSWLYVNFKNPVLRRPEVRRALYAAIDREGMAKSLLRSTAKPAYGFLAPTFEGYDPDYRPAWYKGGGAEEAKSLLGEAGLQDGLPQPLTLATMPTFSGGILPVPMAEWMQNNLRDAGIQLEIKSMETGQFIEQIYVPGMAPKVDLAYLGGGDAPPIFQLWHSAFRPPNGPNIGWYENKEVDKALDRAFVTTDQSARIELIQQAHDAFMEDVGYIPLVNDSCPYLVSPKVQGFTHPGFEWYDLRKVSLAS